MSSKQLIHLRRNKMGMVFQSFALLPHKTVLENIAFPLQVKGTSTPDAMLRAKEMVDLTSLTGRETISPANCPVVSSNASASPDRWRLNPTSGSLTNRSQRLIR